MEGLEAVSQARPTAYHDEREDHKLRRERFLRRIFASVVSFEAS
jgi:hypothetical protein